ncbi:hypothetical protein GCM10007884_10220 [Methylobacterium brachythecii]|nr:hypothetical protein GCM10007884_10220 [Methylobacterium brachythecii]
MISAVLKHGAAVAVLGLSVFAASGSTAVAKEFRRTAKRPYYCPASYFPVCGAIGRSHRFYSNECRARSAGARIIDSDDCR